MSLPELHGAQWALVAVAALCIGLAKAGLGGFAMVSILLMARVFPPRDSTGAILSLLVVGDLFAIVAYRRHAQWPVVWRLLPVAAAGVVCGFYLMPLVPDESFAALIGWITLALLALTVPQLLGFDFIHAAARSRAATWLAGWLGGVTTMVANAAGPVMTVYLLARRLPKLEFVGTAAWFYFFLNLSKLPFSAKMGLFNGSTVALALATAPLVLGGAALGRWALGRIPQRLFEWLLVAFTFVGALRLIVPR